MYRLNVAIASVTMAALTILGKWSALALTALFVTIPIWLLWTWLAPIYFPFAPAVFMDISFLHAAGLVALFSLVREQVRA